MTEIIAENPHDTNPAPSLAERLAAMRAEMDKKMAGVHDPLFTPGERAAMKNWSLHTKLDAAIRYGNKKLRAIRRTPRPAPARRIRAQTRGRARRSPASQRRATTDSGGDDGDGGSGDPEPPHRPFNTPRVGGAL